MNWQPGCLGLDESHEVKGLLVWTDGVTDGSSDAEQVIGAEVVGVVVDPIVVGFGAHEKVIPHVITDAAADINQKVMAAVVTGAEVDATPSLLITVKASALQADAAHEIEADFLADTRLVYGVEVGDDGTKGLSAISAVGCLAGSPGSFKAESDALVEDDVGADAGIQAAFFGAKAGDVAARPRGEKSAEAEHGIALLGRGKRGAEEQGENRYKER